MDIARGASVRLTIDGNRRVAAVCRIHEGTGLRTPRHGTESSKLAMDGGGVCRYGTAAMRVDSVAAGRDGRRATRSAADQSPAFSRSSTATAATELSPMNSVRDHRGGAAKNGSCSAASSCSSLSPISSAIGVASNRQPLGRRRRPSEPLESGRVETVHLTVIASGTKATTVLTTCDSDRNLFD